MILACVIRAPDAPPAGLTTPAPSHTHTTCSGSAAPTHAQHAQAMRTDVCRPPTAGHGAGAARRPGAQQPAPAHQRSAGALGWRGRRSAGAVGWRGRLQPSPPHNTVVVRRGEGTGRSTAAHPAEARCYTPPLRPPPQSTCSARHPPPHRPHQRGEQRHGSEVFLKN